MEQVDAGVDDARASCPCRRGRSRNAGDAVALQRHHAVARGVRQRAQQHPAGHAAGSSAAAAASRLARLQSNSESPLHSRNAFVAAGRAAWNTRAAGAGAERLLRRSRCGPGAAGRASIAAAARDDLVGQMAGQQQELGHAEAHEFAQQPGEERPVAAGQQRLRRGGGERCRAACRGRRPARRIVRRSRVAWVPTTSPERGPTIAALAAAAQCDRPG